MSYSDRRLPFDDLTPRDQLCGLPLPVGQRDVLVAVHDLAPDGLEWFGTRAQLGAQMGCNGGTANRRARAAERSGFLQVDTGSKGGRYRLLCLQPAVPTSAPTSAPNSLPGAPPLRLSTACVVVSRVLQIVVASCINPTFGVVTALACAAEWYRSADQRRKSARPAAPIGVSVPRPIKPARNQPELKGFAEACAMGAPSGAHSAHLGAPSAPPVEQRGAPLAETPAIPDVGAERRSAPASPIPFHSTVPPSSHLSDPIVPSDGDCGTLKRWWRKDIEPQDLRSPAAVQQLCEDATRAGVWPESEQDRLVFFAWAKHCSRIGKVTNRPGLFTAKLGKPNYGKPFAARMAAVDLDWATSAIKSLDQGPLQPPRTSDLAAGDSGFEAARKQRLAELAQFGRRREAGAP